MPGPGDEAEPGPQYHADVTSAPVVSVLMSTRNRAPHLAHRNGQSHAYLWHHWLHSDLRWLRLRQARDTIRLAAYRRRHGHRHDGGIDEAEYDLVFRRSLFSHLAIERLRPAKYARMGS